MDDDWESVVRVSEQLRADISTKIAADFARTMAQLKEAMMTSTISVDELRDVIAKLRDAAPPTVPNGFGINVFPNPALPPGSLLAVSGGGLYTHVCKGPEIVPRPKGRPRPPARTA